jgi:flagellar hook-associated protein 3 FlgL
MISNNIMMNVNRNLVNSDRLLRMISSMRRANMPSDNPLVAARDLRFRNNLAANENFQNNVINASAWMDITSGAIDTIVSDLMRQARDRIHTAANDYLEIEDRNILVQQLRDVMATIGETLNTQMAGRYVFSGLRTNEPPVFKQNEPDLSFNITQSFNLADVERIRSVQFGQNDYMMPESPQTGRHIINLPFRNAAPTTVVPFQIVADGPPLAGVTIDPISVNAVNAYLPDPGQVHFVQETGELVFHPGDVTGNTGIGAFPIEVRYTVTGFKAGDLNPRVYFNAVEMVQAPGATARTPGFHFNRPPGFAPSATAPWGTTSAGDPGDNQHMLMEFGTRTSFPYNTLAKDVVSARFFADINAVIHLVESLKPSDRAELESMYAERGFSGPSLENAVNEHIANETQLFNQIMNTRLNNMLHSIDRHTSESTRALTDTGNRHHRLDLFTDRLEQDEASIIRLISNNIDTDLAAANSRMASAEAALMASMRIGNNIINITMANFLR